MGHLDEKVWFHFWKFVKESFLINLLVIFDRLEIYCKCFVIQKSSVIQFIIFFIMLSRKRIGLFIVNLSNGCTWLSFWYCMCMWSITILAIRKLMKIKWKTISHALDICHLFYLFNIYPFKNVKNDFLFDFRIYNN